jgi:GTPase SAR1 family protein
MGRIGCLVLGPAGSGKSTFCAALERHAQAAKRNFVLVNLDPAAEHLSYSPAVDVRELVRAEDVAEDEQFGPNGALVYAMEHLAENMTWLLDELHAAGPSDDEFFLFDCPGQIELYTHLPAMRIICRGLRMDGMNMCGAFLVDSLMVCGEGAKYLSALLLATSSMLQLELPWVNVLTKVDLLKVTQTSHQSRRNRAAGAHDDDDQQQGGESDDQYEGPAELLEVDFARLRAQLRGSGRAPSKLDVRWYRLNQAMCSLVEEYSMIRFVGLDSGSPDSVATVSQHIDHVSQYGEDLEPKEAAEFLDPNE